MSKKKAPVTPIDQGPPERRQHNKIVVERDVNNRPRLRVIDQTEHDRLLHERKITLDQHTAAEHLYRDLVNAGYFVSARWALDANVRGDHHDFSHLRATTLVRLGLARAWLEDRLGKRSMNMLVSVLTSDKHATSELLRDIRLALDEYQSFEQFWHGTDTSRSVPELLSEMPKTKSHRRSPRGCS